MVKVLLLEDDPGYREIIERVIRRNESCAVRSVATERQAWEELARETFDLVLLDLHIDGKRCWETLKRAVRHPGNPVAIVFSCEDTRGNAERAASLGAYTFLSKPFNIARLNETLDAALAAKRPARPETPGIAPHSAPGAPAVPAASREREVRGRNGFDRKVVKGIVRRFRSGAAVTGHPAYFRIRLKEEFERTLRYRRNLTLALLALKDAEESGSPLRAPHGGPAVAYAQEAIRSTLRRTDIFASFGKNEISLLMPETRSDRVLPRISGLRDRLQTDLAAGIGEAPGVAVWVGMASLPPGDSAKPGVRNVRSPEDFLRMARLALYRARLDDSNPVAIFDA